MDYQTLIMKDGDIWVEFNETVLRDWINTALIHHMDVWGHTLRISRLDALAILENPDRQLIIYRSAASNGPVFTISIREWNYHV